MTTATDSKYAAAGVSIAEGDRAVQLMKDAVKATYTPAVLAGIGAFGGMTLAVMMRASLGHTGRTLQARPALTLAFACVAMAAVARVAVPLPLGLWIAAALWTTGFGIFVWQFGPMLTLPNPARRQPNGR